MKSGGSFPNSSNVPEVETMAAALLERETLDAVEFNMLMEGQELPEMALEVDHSLSDDEPAVESPSDPGASDQAAPPPEPKPVDDPDPPRSDS